MFGDALREWHRPGVERAGAEDELGDEIGLAPLPEPKHQRRVPECPHGFRRCYICDSDTWCAKHGSSRCGCVR